MTRRSCFWLLFLIVSSIAAVAALRLMRAVEPVVSSNITFSRQQAEDKALALQQQLFPGLQTQRSAATFFSDSTFMYYVELEAGGVPQYAQYIEQLDAVTHMWRVRRFTPAQQQELRIDLGMHGENIGYAYTIPDQEPGAALGEAEARLIAEQGARAFIGERFSAYQALESQVTTQASGRVDHTFTYQHATLTAGETRFRYTLTVAGDKLVRIEAGKFIPQGFVQRFGEIRALNTQISQVATLFAFGGFGIAAAISGIWLFRRHQLQYGRALRPALVVAVGLSAAAFANLPNAWLNYQTTASAQTFLLQQVTAVLTGTVVSALVFALIFAVAEALTRLAFADHPRLWDSCRREVAGSDALLGRVLGAYGWTGLFLAYAMAFAWFSSRILGWWQPTGIDSDPNILASMRPALAPIFNALQAGAVEECLFRAVPLSLAMLLGNRYGMRRQLVAVMMIAQCFVFAAAHANYPNLPGYSRVVELLLPALVFGLVYLRFGLLIGILAHFEYDLVLMSMPVFSADNAGLWVDRVLVVLAGLTPLLISGWAVWKQGGLVTLAPQWRNGVADSGQGPLASPQHAPVELHTEPGAALVLHGKWLYGLAAISIVLFTWQLWRAPRIDWPLYQVSRNEAVQLAEEALTERDVRLQGEWHRTVTLVPALSLAMDYVWRESGPAEVQRLLGSYLNTPPWIVTWRHFDGPVEERTELWQVLLEHDGTVREVIHALPEGRAGASLQGEAARGIAAAWIRQQQWADPAQLQQKSLRRVERPARRDFVISYLDNAAYAHEDASAAISVTVTGDTVAAYTRGIDIPEAWTRDRQQQASARQPFRIAAQLSVVLLAGLALAGYVLHRKHGEFSFRVAWPWILLLVLSQAGLRLLTIDNSQARFQTTLPWDNQNLFLVASLALGTAVAAGVTFLVAQAVHAERPRVGANRRHDLLQGSLLGICLLGLESLALLYGSELPYAVNVGDLSSLSPLFSASLRGLGSSTTTLLVVTLVIGLSRFMQHAWQRYAVGALALLYIITNGLVAEESLRAMMAQATTLVAALAVLILLRRRQLGIALTAMLVWSALGQFSRMRSLHVDAAWHAAVSVVVALAAGYMLVRHWYNKGTASQ